LIASGEIWRVIVFVILIVVVQQLDGNILAPHIIGGSVGLTPIGVIAAVTICSHFLGVLGMVIGVPLSAVLAYILNKVIDKKLKKKNLPSDTALYENADFFQSEEFIKASFDVEAQKMTFAFADGFTGSIKVSYNYGDSYLTYEAIASDGSITLPVYRLSPYDKVEIVHYDSGSDETVELCIYDIISITDKDSLTGEYLRLLGAYMQSLAGVKK
jgi:hypothetical protein